MCSILKQHVLLPNIPLREQKWGRKSRKHEHNLSRRILSQIVGHVEVELLVLLNPLRLPGRMCLHRHTMYRNQERPFWTYLNCAMRWRPVFQKAHEVPPRAGNQKHITGSELFGLVPGLQIREIFACRGTDRFQTPITASPSAEIPFRRTLAMHRHSGKLLDLGLENWHSLTRRDRIRQSIPSRLTLTIFGSQVSPEILQQSQQQNIDAPASRRVPMDLDPEPVTTDTRAGQVLRLNEPSSPMEPSNAPVVCEGWAPPPIPIHGPKFRQLHPAEKAELVKLHKNLGHPDPNVFAHHLQVQGAQPHIVEAAREYVCDACVESARP